MLIAIGSQNPVKINAVRKAMQLAFPKAKLVSCVVVSGVSNQPFGDAETMRGAVNRARNALKLMKADFGVGLEGGVVRKKYGLMSSAWCAIVDKQEKLSLGGGMHFHLPQIVIKQIRKGQELGTIMDKLSGETNVKQKGGAIEYLTGGILTRTQAYTQLVKLALVKFRSPEYF